MKINQYNTTVACNTPRKLCLRNPFTGAVLKDGNGSTLDFFVYGAHSDQARNAAKNRKRAETDGADNEQIGAEYLAAITMGWSPNIEDDDGRIEFSHKAAIQLYLTQDWIARQVWDFSNDLGNFDPRRYATPQGGSKKERGSIASRTAAEEAGPKP